MKAVSKITIIKVFLLFLVVYFTFIIRAHNYDKAPPMGHLEEMMYAWSGIYLIETGIPVSWSTLDYPKRAEVYKGKIDFQGKDPKVYVTLYRPWLDQPPLFSMLVGYSAHLYGADRNEIIPSAYIRFPVVIISLLTSIMIFLIAKLVSGYWTGILAMLLYGTVPIIVFSSRLAVAENLIALTFSIMVYLLIKYDKAPKFIYLLSIPLLVGISGLSKPTGFFLLPLAIYLVFTKHFQLGDFKASINRIFFLVIASAPFLAAFFMYGLSLDKDIFWRITSIQSNRPAGFSSLAYILNTPAFDINVFFDSWFIFCLLSGVYFMFSPKKGLERLIIFAFIYWIIIVMISGGEQDLLPWYRFPSYPLVTIMGAWGIQYIFRQNNFFTTFLAIGLLLGSRFLLVNPFRPNILAANFRIIFSALMAPSLINNFMNSYWIGVINRVVVTAVFIIGIYFNVIYIYNQFELVCESRSCPFGPTTFLSEIHPPLIWRLFVLGEPTYR